MSNMSDVEEGLVTAIDVTYLILTGVLILLMQVGFTALEVGGSRVKHVKSLLFKNFMDHAVGCLVWYGFGYAIFQGDYPFAGGDGSHWFVQDIDEYAYLFNQFGFAATAITIVSGAVTGRCRLEPYVWLSFVLTGFVYPIQAHWAWNSYGWAAQMGFIDFAGSCVVHVFGGSCALAGAIIVGPRVGLYIGDKRVYSKTPMMTQAADNRSVAEAELAATPLISKKPRCGGRCRMALYEVRRVPGGHNPIMVVIGAFLLYIGWFRFNTAQRTYSDTPYISARSAVNTLIATGAASTTSFVMTILFRWKFDIGFAANATLAGLVAITAPCGYVEAWAAVVVGILAVPAYTVSCFVVLRILGVDDTLQAISVHMAAGMVGTLWLGLADPTNGLFYTGSLRLFGVQVLGVTAITSLGFFSTLIILFPFKLAGKLAYTDSEQLVGIDYIHFGGEFGQDIDLETDPLHQNSRRHSFDSNHSHEVTGDEPKVNYLPDSSNHSNTTPEHQGLNAELKRVLDDDSRMRHRFRAFLKVAHREEGVEFWDAVNRFKAMPKGKKLTAKMKEATRIIKVYCLESGSKQVNLSSKILRQLSIALNDKPERLVENDLFDEALDELFRDLKAAFADFVENTPNYWLQ